MKTKQSTVCHTCRQHKLGCDGKRPFCSQCLLIGRRCRGYNLDLVFIPHTPTRPARVSRKALSKAYSTNSATVILDAGNINDSIPEARARNRACGPIISPVNSTTSEEFTAVIRQRFLPENEQALSISDLGTTSVCGAWVKILPRLADGARSGGLVFSAVRSFATAILDIGPERRYANFQRFEAYDSTLQQLKRALVAPKSFNIEAAAAILCLAMVELLLPTSNNGFLSHLGGFSALIKSYPPEMFSSNSLHAIFVGCRPILLFQAIYARKSTFLAQERWKTTPFRHHSPSNMQLLVGDVTTLPSILEEADLLQNLPYDTAVSKAYEVKESILEVLKHLSGLNDRIGSNTAGFACHPKQNQGPSFLQNKKPYFQFPNLPSANIHTHIWAFEIICLTELERVDSWLSRHKFSIDLDAGVAPQEPNVQTKIFELAVKVCDSIQYMIQDTMKLYGPASAIFPLKVAYEALNRDWQQNQEHIKHCRELIADLRSKGFSIRTHFPAECVDIDNITYASV